MAFSQDLLTRIVNVQFGKVDQQGLLAAYNNNGGQADQTTLTAYALDSGEEFSGVNMGASGMGYTVLTKGLVCFGKPRDGNPCFMACPNYRDATSSVMRGIADGPSTIKWDEVTNGPVIGLSFARGAFFVTFFSVDSGTTIATSFDGVTFSQSVAFPYDDDHAQAGGNVAGLRESEETNCYVSCGNLDVDSAEDPYYGAHVNLAWSTSSDGVAWSYQANMSSLDNPGNLLGQIGQATTVAGGNGIFVAAATDKKVIMNAGGFPLPYITHTGAAASSATGSDWSTTILPGATPASQDTYSFSSCVTFVQTGKDNGYFLCGGYGYQDNPPDFAPSGGVWKSRDGSDWSQVVNNQLFNINLSAIAKDLSKTTIVRL